MVATDSLNVYLVDDGERHYVLAASPKDAVKCFYDTYFPDDDEERKWHEPETPAELDQDAVTIMRDPAAGDMTKITLRQAVAEHLAGKYPYVPCVLAATVW